MITMSFKEWWNGHFFPKSSKEHKATYITKYKCFIKIPKRRDFKNNKEVISRINDYKNKYKQILSTNKTIVSKHLNFGDLYEELRMNTTLLLNLIINHDETNQSDISLQPKYNQLQRKVNSLKLSLYEQRINEMELEIKIRSIALKEVYYERYLFLSQDKITAIEEELYSLTIQLNNFYQTKEAIKNEKHTYQTEIEINETKENIPSAEMETLVKTKLVSLYKLASLVEPGLVKELKLRNESSLSKLAYLERSLEIYTYTHQKLLEEIYSRLDYYLNISELTKENKQSFLNEISYYEQICQIFKNFSRNLISDELIKKIYTIKFNVLTLDIYDQNESPFNNSHGIELEIYEEIIMSKINKLSMDSSGYMQKTFANDYRTAIRLIKLYLVYTTDFARFDPNLILKSMIMLRLLLACEKENGIEEFFKLQKAKKSDYEFNESDYDLFLPNHISFFDGYHKWEDYLPLDTLFRLDDTKGYTFDFYMQPLNRLYFLFKRHYANPDKTYHLPNGLVKINYTPKIQKSYMISWHTTPIYQELLSLYAINKLDIVTPASLQSWIGEITSRRINSLKLNDNLQYLDINNVINIIIVPPNLTNLAEYKIDWLKIKTLEFEDFENSKFLHNFKNLKKLFSLLILSTTKEKFKDSDEVINGLSPVNIVLKTADNYEVKINLLEEVGWQTKHKSVSGLVKQFIEVVYAKTGHLLSPLLIKLKKKEQSQTSAIKHKI